MIGQGVKDAGKVLPCLIKIKPGQALVSIAGLQQIPLKEFELHERRMRRRSPQYSFGSIVDPAPE
jgi:hypothetical protein